MDVRHSEITSVTERDWPTGTVEQRVEAALAEVRPAIQMDGGDVELVRIEGTVVYVHLSGACNSCPTAPSTLSDFVSERIKLYAPEIDSVRAE
jgi:Fe-S cluster biogenesis protein NfuA